MKDYNYSKNGWVTFKNGKPKMKLRCFISDRARLLSNVNDFNFKSNKEALIAEFNENGLDGIQKVMLIEMKSYQRKMDKQRKIIEKKLKQHHEEQ